MAKRAAALNGMLPYTLSELRQLFVPIAVTVNGARSIGDGERLIFLVACDGVQALIYVTNGVPLLVKRSTLRFNKVHGADESRIEKGRIWWKDSAGTHDAGPWTSDAVTEDDITIKSAMGMHSSRIFDARLYNDAKPRDGGLWSDVSSW